MFPWVNGFQWQVGHLVFLGAFFSVVLGIGLTLVAATVRARHDLLAGRGEELRWRESFSALPPSARACRRTLEGGVSQLCTHGFDCGSCSRCPAPAPEDNPAECIIVNGLRYPLDRSYHRGHTWVHAESDGSLTVGLDAMAARLVGTPDSVELPPPGTLLRANGRGFTLRRMASVFSILSPVTGRVLAHGDAAAGWLLRIRPEDPDVLAKPLLRTSREVRAWVLRELERVQALAGTGGLGLTMADGGELMEDLGATLPARQWDHLCGEMLLDL